MKVRVRDYATPTLHDISHDGRSNVQIVDSLVTRCIKLWVNEWLDGTTRFQMSGAQRAFWIDLLAMAGRSRFPGIICAGMDGELYVG